MEYTVEDRVKTILNQSFIKEYLEDEGITDISFNGTTLWLQHNEKGRFRASVQPSLQEVRKLAKQIADIQKKEITNSEPILDTEIGFLRVNVMHDVISPDGMSFSIRVSRPKLAISSIRDLTVGNRPEIEELFKVLIKAGSNITISGITGSGKTELQKLLVGYIPDNQKISLIEDTRDSHIKKLYPEKDINSWQSLKYEDETKNISIRDLIKAGLRNNPDWLLVSETRGEEAADMLDSAKTGHFIITTLHAMGAMDIPSRLIPMIRSSKAYAIMNDQLVGKEIVDFLRFSVHLEMEIRDGKIERRIKEIVEYTDFTTRGAVGSYLYRENKNYNELTGEYSVEEEFNELSNKEIKKLKDKQIYHLLPDVFKEKTKKYEGVTLSV